MSDLPTLTPIYQRDITVKTHHEPPTGTQKGRAPKSITDRGALPLRRMRHLTDAQGTTTYHPPNKQMRTGGAV